MKESPAFMKHATGLFLASMTIAISACGGGGSSPKSPLPSSPNGPVSSLERQVTVRIHVPAAATQAANKRRREFVGAATSYVLVSQTDSTFTSELGEGGTDVSATSPACTSDETGAAGSSTSPIAGPRTCTVQIFATPTTNGNVDYFEFDTYSSAQTVSTADTLAQAVPTSGRLGSARTDSQIALDTSNTVNVAIDGVIASYVVVPASVSGDGSQVLSAQYSLSAIDSSNETIVAGSADPYTDGTNYPQTFTYADNPTVTQSGSVAATAFLTLTPGGPDATASSPPTSTFEQSGDYLSAAYDPYAGASAYYDTITFTASNSTIATPAQSAIFAPIFVDDEGGNASFTQNDSNPSGGTVETARHRSVRHRSFAAGAGNNYPILSFANAGETETVAPNEYVGTATAQSFTYTLSPGCTVTESGTTAPTVTVVPSPAAGPYTSFAITSTSQTQSAGYTATDASGQAITACSISFTDTNGNSALLEISNPPED
jgi:hypothetical protein